MQLLSQKPPSRYTSSPPSSSASSVLNPPLLTHATRGRPNNRLTSRHFEVVAYRQVLNRLVTLRKAAGDTIVGSGPTRVGSNPPALRAKCATLLPAVLSLRRALQAPLYAALPAMPYGPL